MLLLQRKAIEPDMTWFKVDDSLHSHPKVLATEPAAMGLWVIAGSWSSDNLTEGFVPDHVLPRLLPDSSKLARALVTAGLWRRVQGGYAFHDWTDYNPSAEQVKKERSANAERQKRFRDAKRNAHSNGVTNGATNSVRNGVTNASPSRPVPSVVSVVSHLSRRYARVLDDDDFLKSVIGLIHTRSGRVLAAMEVRTIAAAILERGGNVRDPAAYVLRSIENEPDPIARWLPAPAAASPPPPPAADQHPFKPDSSGATCEVCEFPESNRRHLEAS